MGDNIKNQFRPYMKYIPTAALAFGLVFDIFTIDRPDALFENVTIIGYLVLSALAMLALQARIHKESENKRLLLLGILQFSFGNLASALMVLYARSGTLAGSAIFIIILALLLIGNEVLKNNYARTHLRIVIWFTLLLTYSTLAVPILLNSIGVMTFFVSILIALGLAAFFVFLLSRVVRNSFKSRARRALVSVVLVATGFSGLYFANLIPPVPLALKSIGIYHSVERVDQVYNAQYEAPRWYEFWRETNKTFSYKAGDLAYCFSSVFAPRDLKTEIRHRWERYDETKKEWRTVARIPFPILGGRDAGFRGYTQTSQISEGTWRCGVETARGNLIGRTTFIVENGTQKIKSTTL